MTVRQTRMVRRLLVLVLAFVAGSLGSRAAYACSCVPPPPFPDTAETAEVVFDGEVVRRLADGEYEVRVETVYRGSLPEVVTMRTGGQRSPCGRTLDLGPIAYAGDRDLSVHLCTFGLATGDSARVYGITHQGRPPAPASASATPAAAPDPPGSDGSAALPLAAGAAVVLATAAGAAYLRLRTRRNGVPSAGGTASAG